MHHFEDFLKDIWTLKDLGFLGVLVIALAALGLRMLLQYLSYQKEKLSHEMYKLKSYIANLEPREWQYLEYYEKEFKKSEYNFS